MQPQFLIIDDNRDGRGIIVRAAQRKYPEAVAREFATLAEAQAALAQVPAQGGNWIVLTGTAGDLGGAALVRAVRASHPAVPLIALGNAGDALACLTAGASHFLDYEAWLLLRVMINRVTESWSAPGDSARRAT